MSIENELTDFLARQTAGSETASRDIDAIKDSIKSTRRLSNQNGIVNLKQLAQEDRKARPYLGLIRTLIDDSDDVWTKDDGDDFWYVYEDKGGNPLRNFAKKVFSVVERAELDTLAEAFRNALDARKGQGWTGFRYQWPPVDLLNEYLASSSQFVNDSRGISYLGSTNHPTPIEMDIVAFLQSNLNAKSADIRAYLKRRGHERDNSIKRVFNSPFVHKSGSRRNYVYNLVGELNKEAIEIVHRIIPTDRYLYFKNLLDELEDTDKLDKQNRRMDQPILRDWLFENKEFESCGICGNDYSVNALIAPHKKKRSECRNDERRDPYIVMPICVFGCDFLYEHGHINIRDGMVSPGTPIQHDGPEKERVAKLINKEIDERWLQGPETYFR
ncbi:MAG: hypothetical protein F4Y63_07220 [Chloroflexi bacterium]|nr:hypothetical protein [Chloroflexota bacterium]